MPLGLDQGVGALIWSPLGWSLDPRHMAALDAASDVAPIYPYWHQRDFPMLNEGRGSKA